jgi:hypothetical protein
VHNPSTTKKEEEEEGEGEEEEEEEEPVRYQLSKPCGFGQGTNIQANETECRNKK